MRLFFMANAANLLHKNFQLSPSQCKSFRSVEYNICIVHCLKLAQLKEKQTERQKNEKKRICFQWSYTFGA